MWLPEADTTPALPTPPKGATLWLTGLSGAGKTTIGQGVIERLGTRGLLLDGDRLRHTVNEGLGFSREDRRTAAFRAASIAIAFGIKGKIALVCMISPYQIDRDHIRARHLKHGVAFYEIFVNAPLRVCQDRDPKGLYAKVRNGEIRGFTGVDDPYEAPTSPDLELDSYVLSAESCISQIMYLLGDGRHLDPIL